MPPCFFLLFDSLIIYLFSPHINVKLQYALYLLVPVLQGRDQSLIQPAVEMLKYLIRTSTTSMTSVPKPLKYLSPHYDTLKKSYQKMDNSQLKKGIADVISLLAMGTAGGEEAKNNRECLKYCLRGKVSSGLIL